MAEPITTAPAAGCAVDVSNLCLSFAGNDALRDVSFAVEPGTVHALIGPNGAGKSSLFNILCGIYRADSGDVRVDGTSVLRMAPHSIAALGVGRAFQNASMVGGLSVEENLLLGRHRLMRSGVLADGLRLPSARSQEREARERVNQIASFLEIEDLMDSPAAELPYGAAKRVDIARALSSDPRLLLLDEPAAGTHSHEKGQIGRAIRRICDELGTTVLLVEHDMALVMGVSDVVTVLNFGTVLTTGTPEQVRTDARVISAYLGGAANPEKVMRQ